jgi:hypothetical protein
MAIDDVTVVLLVCLVATTFFFQLMSDHFGSGFKSKPNPRTCAKQIRCDSTYLYDVKKYGMITSKVLGITFTCSLQMFLFLGSHIGTSLIECIRLLLL